MRQRRFELIASVSLAAAVALGAAACSASSETGGASTNATATYGSDGGGVGANHKDVGPKGGQPEVQQSTQQAQGTEACASVAGVIVMPIDGQPNIKGFIAGSKDVDSTLQNYIGQLDCNYTGEAVSTDVGYDGTTVTEATASTEAHEITAVAAKLFGLQPDYAADSTTANNAGEATVSVGVASALAQ